jgi:hypothetical protein
LAASVASTGKAIPSASGSAIQRASESLQSTQKNHLSGVDEYVQGESFRTSGDDATVTEEYEQFQQPSHPFNQDNQLKEIPTSKQWTSEFVTESDHIREYSKDDGLEVQQLLSDPYFVAMTDDMEPEQDQTIEEAADLFNEPLSSEEKQAAESLKADLPPAPIHQPVAADNPRNLVANFEALLTDNHAIGNDGIVHFHSEEQQKQWYSEWSGVLNQYTDEVWGDMLPIVREEQKHAEAIKEGKESIDSKSVQRLNMILGHVEQYRHAHPGPQPISSQQPQSAIQGTEDSQALFGTQQVRVLLGKMK